MKINDVVLRRAILFLESNGVTLRQAFPPMERLLWFFGIHLPPPLFQGFSLRAIVLALVFFLTFSGTMFLLALPFGVRAIESMPLGAIVSITVGVTLAEVARRTAEKLRLPSWKAYLLETAHDTVQPSWPSPPPTQERS